MLFALADEALAASANSRGYKALAPEVKIDHFEAASAGDTITAEASPIDIRKRVSLRNIELKNGNRIGVAKGMAYHLV